jgi:integrase
MGTLFKRGEYYYANYVDRSGERQRAALRTTDRQVAKARLRELELATTDRAPDQTEALDAALTYFLDVACAAKPAGTIRSYSQKARHVSRLLGGTLADKLSREGVERYIATRLEEGAHTHTVHKELVVLRGALRSAAERGRFHGSIDAVVPKFDAGYEPRRVYLTPEQFMTLTENVLRPIGANATEAQRARHEARRIRRTLYCLLIALASPRLGEVEALCWEHVDLARDVITIPKGKTVARVVKLHPVLRLWLEHHWQESGPIVEPWGKVSRDLPRLCERIGLPRCTPNDLRRTFASWLVQGGASLYVVSRLLGHKSTRMVELVYGQLDDATLANAIGRMPGGSWDAGGTSDASIAGAIGHGQAQLAESHAANSVEKSTNRKEIVVPRVGIEPTTRGFSVPIPNEDKPAPRKPKLKLVG